MSKAASCLWKPTQCLSGILKMFLLDGIFNYEKL